MICDSYVEVLKREDWVDFSKTCRWQALISFLWWVLGILKQERSCAFTFAPFMCEGAGLIFPLTFFATYAWAVSLGHTDKVWPYISDTGGRVSHDDSVEGNIAINDHWPGTVPPESCFFGQMLNIGALLVVITFFIRLTLRHSHQTIINGLFAFCTALSDHCLSLSFSQSLLFLRLE